MGDKPLISVIVPCYNYARFLPETLECLLQQTYTNWECIVVDDGSTDNTQEVCRHYSQKDQRIRFIHQHNQGLSTARNNGIKAAKGTFIQLLDSDDTISDFKLEHQLNVFITHPETDMVYSNYKLMDEDGSNPRGVEATNWIEMRHEPFREFLLYWEKGFTIPIHCYLFRKSCFERWGYFQPQLPTHEDLDIQLRFSLFDARYKMLNEHSAFYRLHKNSMARDYTNMHKGYLMALVLCLQHKQAGFSDKLLICHRYFQEVLNTLLDTLRGRKNSIFKALNNPGTWGLNLTALLVSPLYVIIKLSERVLR